MTDAEPKTAGAASNLGVKKGLPSRSLKDAEMNAAKVWEVARRGTAPPGAVAAALGLKGATGGTWARHIALLRAFGFIRVAGEEISLTDLGIDVVQDADPTRRQEARRKAFFNVRAYRELVEGYDGEDLPPLVNIASKLRFDYGKSEGNATEAAEAFVESLKHAGLVDGTVVRKVPLASSAPEAAAPPSNGATQDTDLDESAEDDVEEALDAAWEYEGDDEGDGSPDNPAAGVTLAVTLDFSRFRADEVIAILGALGLARP